MLSSVKSLLTVVCRKSDTIPLARFTWNDHAQIMWLLDAGAYGIICPLINTRAEAEAFVGACRYVPLGYRSLGPTRGDFACVRAFKELCS